MPMSDTGRVPHRCARGPRCPDRDYTTTDHAPTHPHHQQTTTITTVGAPIPTTAGLCPLCTGHTAQAIAHLPLDVAELTVLMAAGGHTATEKVRSTPDPTTPIRVGVEAVRHTIDTELQAWAEPVAEQLGIDWDTHHAHHSRIGHRVQRAARLLAAAVPTLLRLGPLEHLTWVGGEPARDADGCHDVQVRDGIDGALHLMELHRRVFAVAGRTRLVHRLGAPCPWCGQRTLTRENGADAVRCGSGRCRGRSVPEQCYDWLAAVVAAEEKRQKAA